MELSDYEALKVKVIYNAVEERRMSAEEALGELELLINGENEEESTYSVCECEDRPCCGCEPSWKYNHDADAPDYEELRDRAEQRQLEFENLADQPCSICKQYFEDDDNEDDIVQGFHADCAENQE